jgi:hypothetical protein
MVFILARTPGSRETDSRSKGIVPTSTEHFELEELVTKNYSPYINLRNMLVIQVLYTSTNFIDPGEINSSSFAMAFQTNCWLFFPSSSVAHDGNRWLQGELG